MFNSGVVDGQAGLFSRGGASSFSGYTVKTDDAKFSIKKTSGEVTQSALSAAIEESAASAVAADNALTSGLAGNDVDAGFTAVERSMAKLISRLANRATLVDGSAAAFDLWSLRRLRGRN